MSYPKQLVIGYGTGRCGSKSLAAFLNRQRDIHFTHEAVDISYWPLRTTYRDSIAKLMEYDSPIIGDIAPQWINYLDRLVEDFPSVKFIYMSRGDIQEVTKSFYSYLKYSNKRELFGDECHGWYPVQEEDFSIEAIHRSIKRYEWLARVAIHYFSSRIFIINTKDLNKESVQTSLLDWLGAEKPYNLGMPHVNKRDYMIKKAKEAI